MKVAAICLVFLGVVAVGWALQCYQCNTVTNGSGCGDPFDTSAQSRFKKTCIDRPVCLKGVIGSDVVRSCGRDSRCPAASHCERGLCTYCCDTDFCNSATTLSFNLILTAAMFVLARIFY